MRTVQPHHRNIATGEPLMLTEFGGISLRPSSGERWWGYGTVDNAQSFLAKYEELLSAVLGRAPIAGVYYTQLTDTEQETNGLLRADRIHKLDPSAVREITKGIAQSHTCGPPPSDALPTTEISHTSGIRKNALRPHHSKTANAIATSVTTNSDGQAT